MESESEATIALESQDEAMEIEQMAYVSYNNEGIGLVQNSVDPHNNGSGILTVPPFRIANTVNDMEIEHAVATNDRNYLNISNNRAVQVVEESELTVNEEPYLHLQNASVVAFIPEGDSSVDVPNLLQTAVLPLPATSQLDTVNMNRATASTSTRPDSPSLLSNNVIKGQLPCHFAPSTLVETNDDYSDEASTCPICFDNWTNIGDHRLCALKCGHLFGNSCIRRWFTGQKKKDCPTCKKKASNSDIRYIYAKKLIAMDATELHEIKVERDRIIEEKNQVQLDLLRTVCKENLLVQQVDDLKKQIKVLDNKLELMRKTNVAYPNKKSVRNETVRLYMDKSIEICNEGGCRVLDYYHKHHLIVTTMKSSNNLFPGFGIRKIDILTYKPTGFIPLHNMPIRDIRFHSENPWLLSVSLDQWIKVIDTQTNIPISTYANTNAPLWSCCWDINDSNMFYIGKSQGTIDKFDLRSMLKPVCTLEVPGDMSPVASVASMSVCPGNAVAFGGIISCKLNSLWVFEKHGEEYVRYPLPIEGPFISMVYQDSDRQLLVSTRPNTKTPYSRYHVFSIENGPANNMLCNTRHCFPGSSSQTLLSRSCIVTNNSQKYVVAYQEAKKSTYLWNINNGQHVASVPARDHVLDLCGVSINGSNRLLSLGERKLEIFRFA